MAVIRSFEVQGLAGQKTVTRRELDPQLNVLWGLNGSGKTSLLKILHSALRNDTSILRGVAFQSAEVVFYSQLHKVDIVRSVSAEQSDGVGGDGDEDGDEEEALSLEPIGGGMWREKSSSPRREWRSEFLNPGSCNSLEDRSEQASRRNPLLVPYHHAFLPISRLTTRRKYMGSFREGRDEVTEDTALDNEFARQIRDSWQEYNTSALASIRAIQQTGLASILSLLFGGSLNASLTSHEGDRADPSADQAYQLVRDFLQEQRIYLPSGESGFRGRYEKDSVLRAVVASIQGVQRDVAQALQPQEQLRDIIESLFSGNKHLVLDAPSLRRHHLQVEANGKPIPLQSLSSGEKQLLRLLLAVLGAGESTVMIDEPELSMHVDWQEQLLESMRMVNPYCQLIVATHSPEVMANVSEEVIYQL